jgi:hypothetical protein
MSSKSTFAKSLFLTALAAGLAGLPAPATAQTSAECPLLPQDAATLRWEVLRTDSALLCRAVDRDTGKEAFAVTLMRKSPFRPDSALREEQSTIQGERVWWYRGEIAGRPNLLVRETLVKIGKDQIAHVSIRTPDAETLGRYQTVVQGLQFGGGLAAR